MSLTNLTRRLPWSALLAAGLWTVGAALAVPAQAAGDDGRPGMQAHGDGPIVVASDARERRDRQARQAERQQAERRRQERERREARQRQRRNGSDSHDYRGGRRDGYQAMKPSESDR